MSQNDNHSFEDELDRVLSGLVEQYGDEIPLDVVFNALFEPLISAVEQNAGEGTRRRVESTIENGIRNFPKMRRHLARWRMTQVDTQESAQ